MAAKALSFDVGDYVVYPKHGVGRVVELQSQEIAGMQLELYVLRFEKERMTLRSEEHTSELQSLMRISYAVFCLKKKKTQMDKTKYNEYNKHRKPHTKKK